MRLLVCRVGGLADTLSVLPTLDALTTGLDGVCITMLCAPKCAGLITTAIPGIRVVTVDPAEIRGPKAMLKVPGLGRQVGAQDVALVSPGEPLAVYSLCRLVGGRSIGFASGFSRGEGLLNTRLAYDDQRSVPDQLLDFARHLLDWPNMPLQRVAPLPLMDSAYDPAMMCSLGPASLCPTGDARPGGSGASPMWDDVDDLLPFEAWEEDLWPDDEGELNVGPEILSGGGQPSLDGGPKASLLSGLDGVALDQDGMIRGASTTPVGVPRYGVIHPGAGSEAERWGDDRFRELVPRLIAETGLAWHVVDEDSYDLADLAALFAGAEIFIGCHSGPLQLAAAQGIPWVAVGGATSLAWDPPWIDVPGLVVRTSMACQPCAGACGPIGADCHDQRACLSQVTPDQVIAGVQAVLTRSRGTWNLSQFVK